MLEFLRRIPLAGRVFELIAGDSPKKKLKNKLRRICANAELASALLHSLPTFSVQLAGDATMMGNSWNVLDTYIDSLDDKTVLIISIEINWAVLPLIFGIGVKAHDLSNEQQNNTKVLLLWTPTDIFFPFCPLGVWGLPAPKNLKKTFQIEQG